MIKSINLKAWFCAAAGVAIFVCVLTVVNQQDVKDETARMAKLSQPHIIVSIR